MAFDLPAPSLRATRPDARKGTGCALCNNAIFAAIDETESC
jgi:hypothetical protein